MSGSKVPSDELMKNGIVATTGVLVCNRLMDQQRFDVNEHADDETASRPAKWDRGLYGNLMSKSQMAMK